MNEAGNGSTVKTWSCDAGSANVATFSARSAGARVAVALTALALLCVAAAPGTARAADDCPNAELRTGPARHLPDCRAYELITPPDLRASTIGEFYGTAIAGGSFGSPLVRPSGDSVLFGLLQPLAGTESGGSFSTYQSLRGPSGWTVRLASPTGVESVKPVPGNASWDHGYAFWETGNNFDGGDNGTLSMEDGNTKYVRQPDGSFQLLGNGSIGDEPKDVWGHWISPGGDHVIFSTLIPLHGDAATQLEPDAPASAPAVYDRTADGLKTVSLLPGDVTPSVKATYQGASVNGETVMFSVGTDLFARIDNERTLAITSGTWTPAGASQDGSDVFYVQGGDAYSYDTVQEETTRITSTGDAKLVNISADGSHVYFISSQQVDGAGAAGQPNLYVWRRNGAATDFIATVAASDLTRKPGLARWTTDSVNPKQGQLVGPVNNASRATPDGSVLVFESVAKLTDADNAGKTAIYRYDTADESLICVSCRPDGEPLEGGAWFQPAFRSIPDSGSTRMINNLTEDGDTVVFETTEPLSPFDVGEMNDVYRWKAGAAGSEPDLSLVSSGLGYGDLAGPLGTYPNNVIWGVSGDGTDIVFMSNDALVSEVDSGGVPMLYDARVDGGFAMPTEQECVEDACQDDPSNPPADDQIGSTGTFPGDSEAEAADRQRCKRLTRRARKADRRVNRLERRAHRAHGKRAKSLRRRSHRMARRAAELQRRAQACARRSK